ncbi:unnamed protein product [Prorocentrum cordatum]|uniref:Uncharacterized protein n=1 Tax=Prorocentrum cordatum TaxID=2364126 RepID=A0ABN9PMJ0_9DINO|nr:unnamed protein product [Polarella glacialis]
MSPQCLATERRREEGGRRRWMRSSRRRVKKQEGTLATLGIEATRPSSLPRGANHSFRQILISYLWLMFGHGIPPTPRGCEMPRVRVCAGALRNAWRRVLPCLLDRSRPQSDQSDHSSRAQSLAAHAWAWPSSPPCCGAPWPRGS